MAKKEEQLTRFLYILMRDEVTTGTIESILKDHLFKAKDAKVTFSAPYLGKYARELAKHILGT